LSALDAAGGADLIFTGGGPLGYWDLGKGRGMRVPGIVWLAAEAAILSIQSPF
jgi:hypothetical protein